MGFESKVSGYIAVYSRVDKDAIKLVKDHLSKLPKIEDDQWPFMPQDIFSVTEPINKDANSVPILYRSIMIHFAMSVKQLEDQLGQFLIKFENFFKEIPNSYEAKVNVTLTPYTGNYKNNQLTYSWNKQYSKNDSNNWIFNGDPIKLEEICNPINQENFQFTETFKAQIISSLQWIGSQIGKEIRLTDQLTTQKENSDINSTTSNSSVFILKHCGVRTNGTIASLEGDNFSFEFKTDSVRSIKKQNDQVEFELRLDTNITRRINIKTNMLSDSIG